MYEWNSEELVGKSIVNITSTQDNMDEAIEIMELLQKGKTWEGEFLVKTKSGRKFKAYVIDKPIINENNELIGIIGLSHHRSCIYNSFTRIQTSEFGMER